jgi:hypothetical protein
MKPNFRKLWFEHVATTRKKLARKKKPCSHRAAMASASITWPKKKQKISKKFSKGSTSIDKSAPRPTIEKLPSSIVAL